MSLQVIESWNGINDTYHLPNFSQGDIVARSDRVPRGMKFVSNDVGIIFTTSGGSVYFARQLNDGSIKRFSGNISTTTTGSAHIVLNEGERLLVILATTGNGVIDVFSDGELQEKTIRRSELLKPIPVNLRNRGGF